MAALYYYFPTEVIWHSGQATINWYLVNFLYNKPRPLSIFRSTYLVGWLRTAYSLILTMILLGRRGSASLCRVERENIVEMNLQWKKIVFCGVLELLFRLLYANQFCIEITLGWLG